jgi:hypothetical protein
VEEESMMDDFPNVALTMSNSSDDNIPGSCSIK